ncbi:MAG: ABC transporter ATP-binding protein [Candidatus Velthaea sp.]
MIALELIGITKRFGRTDVLTGIDLAVDEGDFVVFVGPSGCGKSTLLRIVAGLEEQTTGQLRIAGARADGVPPAKRGIAMVFQSYALYPHLDVAGNMSLALKREGIARAEIERRLNAAAEMLELTPLLKRKPAALSGGQRQRVAIGRAIVRQPKLFLFDEPLSNLDAALRVNTRLEIANLHRLLGTTMIYVTHDQTEAMTLADKIVVLYAGKIQQAGRPIDLYDAPVNLFVAGFIGSPKMNFIGGDEARRAGAATLGVRPEHLEIAAGDARWNGIVHHVERLGSDTYVYARTAAASELTVRVAGTASVAVGDAIGLAPLPGMLHRFDDQGMRIPNR